MAGKNRIGRRDGRRDVGVRMCGRDKAGLEGRGREIDALFQHGMEEAVEGVLVACITSA